MKRFFKSLLYSTILLSVSFAVSCVNNGENTGYQGVPTIEVTPASVKVGLAGGTTEAVTVTTPAEWVVESDTEGVVASMPAGNGDATVTFEVPATESARTIKITFIATGYVSNYPITKKASLSITQSDSDIPTVDGEFVYYDNCGESVSKVDDYWPYVDAYTGWAPTGGEGFDQSGVTYTGKNASVRNSGKTWAPVGATYATDAPYAYLQAKSDTQFVINNIAIKSGVKSYTFSFTAFNQYASLIASPYTPVVAALESGKNLTVAVSVDGVNWGNVAFTTMADGNWTYAIAPFTLPADASKLYVRFSDYKADTTTPLPSSDYQYQAALRFDDFRLVEGGNGPVVEFTNTGGSTGGGNVPTEAVKATVAEFLAAAEDGTTYYELTGVISNVVNTTYGNFDLTDETGTVYIYGLSSPTGEQKYWSASGAKAGDTITVRTLRTSYNNTPQGKDAIFVSLVPGEGGNEPTPEPAEGDYASDVPFVCAADDSTNAVYSLGTTNIGGQAATGFKLGKGKQQGKFTSTAVGVSGTKYINFYGAAWKGTTATLYFRVDGGAVQSVDLAANTGATSNPPYPITFAATDHYSVKLEGLTETSTIEFSTNADFALTTHSGSAPDIAPRVIVCGVKLSDEPLGTDNPGGGTTPEPEPTPSQTVAINTITADGTYAVEGIVVAVGAKAYVVADSTGSLLVYGAEHGRTLMEKVTVEGSVSRYNGYTTNALQMAATTTTVVSTDNTYEYKPLVIDGATLDTMVGADAACIEVQITGVISVGSYANITVEGATKQASLYYVNTADYAAFDGKNVVVKGYITGTYNYLNILPYSVTEVGGTTPTPDPEPTPSEYTTVADFIAAAEDDTIYTLKGTITSVANTTYGNFDLTDETGTVLIYGLCSPEGESKYWAASGAKLGDDIVVKTVRTSYSNTPQGKDAIFVELITPGTIAFWSFDKSIVSFTAAAGSQSVAVEAYNLKSDVVAVSDNSHFSASYADGVLTINAAENTTTDVIKGNITVTCGTLEKVIAVSQSAPSTGGEQQVVDATVTFDSLDKRTSKSDEQAVWEENGITVVNDKDASTTNIADYVAPARFYKSSKITVTAPGTINVIVFDCNTAAYATSLAKSIGSSATADNDKVTVALDGSSTSYSVSLTDGQVRMDSLTVTYTK